MYSCIALCASPFKVGFTSTVRCYAGKTLFQGQYEYAVCYQSTNATGPLLISFSYADKGQHVKRIQTASSSLSPHGNAYAFNTFKPFHSGVSIENAAETDSCRCVEEWEG